MARGPYLPNNEALIAQGFNPETGLPFKIAGGDTTNLASNIKQTLAVIDRQDAMGRYVWTGLPKGITGEMIERILYFKGQAALFYLEATDKYYFLPYALDGEVDCYGRWLGITPLPFGGGTTQTGENGKVKPWITGLIREPVYELDDILYAITEEDINGKCVIFRDYTNGISQFCEPRALMNDSLLDVMSKCIPYMRTALMNGTGIQGVKVHTQGEAQNVQLASHAIEAGAIQGQKYIPVVGELDFQELTAGNVSKSEEFMLALQSLDNFRLGTYGIKNGGVFAKKAHMLEAEQETNQGNTGLVYNDGLALRQFGCILANGLFGLDMWCEASEAVMGIDKNMDGEISDEQDGQLPMDHPMQAGGNEE